MALVLCNDMGDGITQIILNRAPVNALSPGFLMEFSDKLDQLAADTSVRGVVISSAFRTFSAGLDLKEAVEFDLNDEYATVKSLNVAFLNLFAFPKPVVTAITGAAIAGGLFFVLASDYRVAGPKAKFGLAEIRVGVDFPVGPMEIARATLAPNDLRRLMLAGQPITAAAAETSGLVDALVAQEDVVETAIAMAKAMAGSPPKAYAAVKRQIRGDTIARIQQAMDQGANEPADGWFTDETKSAMRRMIG
ncbi:MAG: enoyl-CoA hydratase [Granulosicoccus sp.]|jgi:enoyl-CoA hydratase